jgi:tetratricopeptide (TPR) repeat protein
MNAQGKFLCNLGVQHEKKEMFHEASITYGEAKDLLERAQGKAMVFDLPVKQEDKENFVRLLDRFAFCSMKAGRWDMTVPALKEALALALVIYGPDHLEYAVLQVNLGEVYVCLKQFEEGISVFNRVLPLHKKTFGERDARTRHVMNNLEFAIKNAQVPDRHNLDVHHNFRMCNGCETVREGMDMCNGCAKVWYCNTECQLKHWPIHKKACSMCAFCETGLDAFDVDKRLRCSRCKVTHYCGTECQNAHWSEHKKTCCPPKK